MSAQTSAERETWPVLLEYGETERGTDGCHVVVQLVQTPRGGTRVRFLLHRDGAAVRHMDLTGPTAQRLWPILQKAFPAGKETT